MMKTPDFCLKFRVFEQASLGTHVSTQNMEKKNHWYAEQRILIESLSQNRATICYECLKRSEMYVKKTCELSAIISCYYQQEILIESVFLIHIKRVVYTPGQMLRPRPYCYYFVMTSP